MATVEDLQRQVAAMQQQVSALWTRWMSFDSRSSPDLGTSSVITPPLFHILWSQSLFMQAGAAFSGGVIVTDGYPPYTFGIYSGALPVGVALNSDGSITGIPLAAGVGAVSVLVTDHAGYVAQAPMTWIVAAATSSSTPAERRPILSGFTFSNSSPGPNQVAWSAGTVTYKGVTYNISAGNCAGLNVIYWSSGGLVFQAYPPVTWPPENIPAFGEDDWVIGFNGTINPGVQGLFEVCTDIHDRNATERTLICGEFIAGYNNLGKMIWDMRRSNASSTGFGVLELRDGTGVVINGVQLRGDANPSTFGSGVSANPIIGTGNNFNWLQIPNIVPGAVAPATTKYIPVNIGGALYYIAVYQ